MKSKYLDILDGYFSGTLDDQGRLDLENQLRTDPRFEQLFKEYKDLRKGIDYSIMRTLKEELQVLEASLPEVQIDPQEEILVEKPALGGSFVLWKIAAVVILVAVSVVVVFQLQAPTTPQELFIEYFEPYPNEFVSAKRGDDVNADPLVQSFLAYDNQDYPVAIQGFNNLLAEDENLMVLFYLGSAQLAIDESQAAIGTFERFLEISEDYVIEAKWYLALSYLREDRKSEARSLLEEIKLEQKFGKSATTILEEIPK